MDILSDRPYLVFSGAHRFINDNRKEYTVTDINNAQTDGTTTTEQAAPKVKRIRRPSAAPKAATAPKGKVKADAKADKPAAKPAKAATTPKPKVEKPTRPLYAFDTSGQGQSTALNQRVSRTAIDHSRFGIGNDWAMTERDQKSVEMLRKQFGGKPFKRENLDAGIIRRLGERGCIEYVGGTFADSQYKLTNKGLGKPEPRAKRAANG